MAKFAKVIVDVPTLQTNQPYTYLIPAALQDSLQVGMRVAVPFGKGDRNIQGFIVALVDELGPNEQALKLKELLFPLELQPILNDEALLLGDWLAHHTFAFKISCYQAMLPAALRSKYYKTVELLTEEAPVELQALFQGQREIPFPEDSKTIRQLVKFQQAHQVKVNYHLTNQAKKKLVNVIQPALTVMQMAELLEDIPVRAVKQRALLSYLMTLDQAPIAQKIAQTQSGLPSSVFLMGVKKGWITQTKQEAYRNPYDEQSFTETVAKVLLPEQTDALAAINTAITTSKSTTFLLEGVTGSGKTEVYLQAISQALEQGKTALMLVPEIALTPQMVRRVKERFGKNVAVLHSGLSVGEKYDEWRRIKQGAAQVVVGARSAIFAPLNNLGVIIMDEEHEKSYKQDEMPRYHARDVAKWRSQYHNCPLVLGSATPSLESRARALKGRYQLLTLTKRVNQQPLPAVKIVDMKEAMTSAPSPEISQELLQAIKTRLARSEQVVLLLNRRGYSSFLMCRECGFIIKCPNCDISLTLHLNNHSLQCHYCGHQEPQPFTCPSCHQGKMRPYGSGTEKIEQQLHDLLPTAKVLRMDVDTTRKKGAHEQILKTFGNQEADILLGTQMIAKGLDFPNVTLVGVLNADTALGLPNYRSSEDTFQLLTQVSGRAGRGEKTGEVIVQTYNPDHYAIQLAKTHNYERFFQEEMQMRHLLGYAPYYFTLQIKVSSKDENAAAKKIYEINRELQQIISNEAIILGPSKQGIAKIKQRYYYQLVIKYKKEPYLDLFLQKLLMKSQKDERRDIKIVIDREPLNLS